MRVVLAGGSGFLGSMLGAALAEKGHAITVLTRRPRRPGDLRWDPYGSLEGWAHTLDGADAVVNLAGASIGKRWTTAHKREMWNSRVRLTRSLVAAMHSVRNVPRVLINASAVGIYGARGDQPLTEESSPGTGFLAALCKEWEKEAMVAASRSRVVLLRNGLVFDSRRGVLPQMARPFLLFAGGPVGTGRQVISWIHRDDWTAMACRAVESASVSGPLNVTSPNAITNREFARTLGRVLHRPSVVPAPAFAVRLILGEMADAILTGQRVLPAKAREMGFEFRYPDLESALRAEYSAQRA
jgi:uncharacterized protein (TIGR01777 family)